MFNRIIEIFENKIGPINKIEQIKNESRFLIFCKDKKYLCDVFSENHLSSYKSAIYSFQKIGANPCINPILYSDSDPEIGHYILTEQVDGKTLKELFETQNLNKIEINYLISQFINYLKFCHLSDLEGFGIKDDEGNFPFLNWFDCLKSYTTSIRQRLKKLSSDHRNILEPYLDAFEKFLVANRNYFLSVKSKLTSANLELNKLQVTEDKKLKIPHAKANWGADPLFACGIWMGNTYKTEMFDAFIEHWEHLDAADEQIIHAYALLNNLCSLLKILEVTKKDIHSAKPAGNPNYYLDLMDEHLKFNLKLGPELNLNKNITKFSFRNDTPDKAFHANLIPWTKLSSRVSEILLAIRRFCSIEFDKNKESFFVLIYGSYAYKLAQPTSDLDIVFVAENCTPSRRERVIHFVKTLHDKYGMNRDDEVPYEKKILIPYDFMSRACRGDGIYSHGQWAFPKITKSKENLSSDDLLLRFFMGVMANPHIFVDGNVNHYNSCRTTATQNLIRAIVYLNQLKQVSAISLAQKFCKNAAGESGDYYLGFSYVEPFKAYLAEHLESNLSQMNFTPQRGFFGTTYRVDMNEITQNATPYLPVQPHFEYPTARSF